MQRKKIYILSGLLFLLVVGISLHEKNIELPEKFTLVESLPKIEPDYSGVVVPYNIAPLNFNIRTTAKKFIVSIHSADGRGEKLNIASANGEVVIDQKKWRKLLESNKGGSIALTIFAMDESGAWSRYKDIVNRVSEHPIPPYLSYRYMKPTYSAWGAIDIVQQSLEDSSISKVIDNSSDLNSCINCHAVSNGGSMAIGFRNKSKGVGTLLCSGGEVRRLDSKWGYTSWHPSSEIAAYSMNKVNQFFHTGGDELRDVIDMDSAIAIYSVKDNKVTKVPCLTDPNYLETYPTFSPDGKYLYFCRAPVLWEDRNTVPPPNYRDVRYSIMRVPYNADTNSWGEMEKVISAEETGKSLLVPRISPDGKYMIFNMCDYGCFPVFQNSSDLHIFDIEKRTHKALDVLNSQYSESWHNYSKCGKWLVYSSKKQGGFLTRSYFSYIDDKGNAHKPFVLPQKNPEHYYTDVHTYSVPEFLYSPVTVKPHILSKKIDDKKMALSVLNAISGATPKSKSYENSRE